MWYSLKKILGIVIILTILLGLYSINLKYLREQKSLSPHLCMSGMVTLFYDIAQMKGDFIELVNFSKNKNFSVSWRLAYEDICCETNYYLATEIKDVLQANSASDSHILFPWTDKPNVSSYAAVVGHGSYYDTFTIAEGDKEYDLDAVLLISLPSPGHWILPGDYDLSKEDYQTIDPREDRIAPFLLGFADGSVWEMNPKTPWTLIAKYLTVDTNRKVSRKDDLWNYAVKRTPPRITEIQLHEMRDYYIESHKERSLAIQDSKLDGNSNLSSEPYGKEKTSPTAASSSGP